MDYRLSADKQMHRIGQAFHGFFSMANCLLFRWIHTLRFIVIPSVKTFFCGPRAQTMEPWLIQGRFLHIPEIEDVIR
jgi:hypothetical protein